MIQGITLEFGKVYELPVKFLHAQLALAKLSVGQEIRLWEGRDIAFGKVVRLRRA
jgi:hypothetical protein